MGKARKGHPSIGPQGFFNGVHSVDVGTWCSAPRDWNFMSSTLTLTVHLQHDYSEQIHKLNFLSFGICSRQSRQTVNEHPMQTHHGTSQRNSTHHDRVRQTTTRATDMAPSRTQAEAETCGDDDFVNIDRQTSKPARERAHLAWHQS